MRECSESPEEATFSSPAHRAGAREHPLMKSPEGAAYGISPFQGFQYILIRMRQLLEAGD